MTRVKEVVNHPLYIERDKEADKYFKRCQDLSDDLMNALRVIKENSIPISFKLKDESFSKAYQPDEWKPNELLF